MGVRDRNYADLAQLVERDLAKVEVAGSTPVIRSTAFCRYVLEWRHSQAVRQRSAKPLSPSSILGGASNLFDWGAETKKC